MNADRTRLIACDLDGTLLNSKHECSDYTVRVWQKILEKGLRFVPVTGRPFSAVKRGVPLDLCSDVICINGVHVYRKNENGQIAMQREKNLDWDTAVEVLEKHREHVPHIHVHLYQGEALYSCVKSEYSDEYSRRTKLEYGFLDNWDQVAGRGVSKLMFISWDNKDLQDLKRALGSVAGIDAVFSSDCYLEVFSNQASKGTALQYLLSEYELKEENLLVFGDSYNDVSMFEISPRGFVMKNASADLLPHLPRTEFSNDEDGVVKTLEALFL